MEEIRLIWGSSEATGLVNANLGGVCMKETFKAVSKDAPGRVNTYFT